MQKLFLFKSDEDYRNQTSDVFVALEHITSIKLGRREDNDFFVAADLDNDNSVVARFTSEKKAKVFLHSLFEAMREDTGMVEKLRYFKMDTKKEELLNILGRIKDKLSD